MLIPNTTCDYFEGSHQPGTNAPDIGQLQAHLDGDFMRGNLGVEKLRWTHVLLVRGDVAINVSGLPANRVYVPDLGGTCFEVVFVELENRGRAGSFKRVYLERKSITWPSEEL